MLRVSIFLLAQVKMYRLKTVVTLQDIDTEKNEDSKDHDTTNVYFWFISSNHFCKIWRWRRFEAYITFPMKTSRQEWTHHSTILEESHPNTILWHLIIYNLWFRIFSEKLSGSKKVSHCPLQPCKKLDRSLEPFWRKSQESWK